MAGTAAGIAKARAARQARQAQRAALDQKASEATAATEAAQPLVAPPVGLVDTVRSVGEVAEPQAAAVSVSGQDLAENLVDAALPEAVQVLIQGMRRPNTPTMRHAAACKLLDLGLKTERKRGSLGTFAGNLRDALELRKRKAGAVDAVPAGADPVAPAAVEHSPQAPDTLSE